MSGYEVILKSKIEGINVEEHALCSSCKRVVHQHDCTVCGDCDGFTCDRCSRKGRFTCCLASCLESAAIAGECVLAANHSPLS